MDKTNLEYIFALEECLIALGIYMFGSGSCTVQATAERLLREEENDRYGTDHATVLACKTLMKGD